MTHTDTRHRTPRPAESSSPNPAPSRARTAPTPWGHLLGLALGLAAALAVVATAFVWPGLNSGPNGVPLGLVAPDPVAEQVSAQLSRTAGEDAFILSRYDDRAAAEDAVRDREVYGALVLGPNGGELLTASAASPSVAQALAQLAAEVPAEAGGPLAVTDLVPLPEDDPRGIGLGAAVLPLVIGGLATGVVTALRVRGSGRQLATVMITTAAGGLAVAAVVQGWLGALTGSYLANAAVLALGMLAIAVTALGLHRVLSGAGLGLAAVVMVLLGNPLSGAMSAPELLPDVWGALGQWLPPGAASTALRSVAWFDGAGSGPAFVALGAWLVLGTVLAMLPARRR